MLPMPFVLPKKPSLAGEALKWSSVQRVLLVCVEPSESHALFMLSLAALIKQTHPHVFVDACCSHQNARMFVASEDISACIAMRRSFVDFFSRAKALGRVQYDLTIFGGRTPLAQYDIKLQNTIMPSHAASFVKLGCFDYPVDARHEISTYGRYQAMAKTLLLPWGDLATPDLKLDAYSWQMADALGVLAGYRLLSIVPSSEWASLSDFQVLQLAAKAFARYRVAVSLIGTGRDQFRLESLAVALKQLNIPAVSAIYHGAQDLLVAVKASEALISPASPLISELSAIYHTPLCSLTAPRKKHRPGNINEAIFDAGPNLSRLPLEQIWDYFNLYLADHAIKKLDTVEFAALTLD